MSLRNTVKVLKVPERQFIAQLLAWQVLHREKDRQLCANTEYAAAAYFASAFRPVLNLARAHAPVSLPRGSREP